MSRPGADDAHDELADHRGAPEPRHPVPAIADQHAGVDEGHAGDPVGVVRGPGRGKRATEVMCHQVHPRHVERADHTVEEPGVAVDRVIAILTSVRGTEARQIRRDDTRERSHPGHQWHPVRTCVGVSVDEHHGLAGLPGAAHQHRRAEALDGEPSGFDHVRELTKHRCSPVRGSSNSNRWAISLSGAVKSTGCTGSTSGYSGSLSIGTPRVAMCSRN